MKSNFLGFYQEITDFNPKLTSVNELLIRKPKQVNKQVLSYLKNGYLLFTSRDRHDYLKEGLIPINDVYTDGKWLWTAYYIYFVEEGLEQVPELFINHMRLNKFQAPTLANIADEEIEMMSKAYFEKEYIPN